MDELFSKDVPLAPEIHKGHKKEDWENFVLVGMTEFETLKAVNIHYDDGDCWLPLSQIKVLPLSEATLNKYQMMPEDGSFKEFHMPLWLARDKGLI